MAKYVKDGYGQIEPNRCSFLHDGNIESQCVANEAIENGAIVNVDKANGTVVNATSFTTGLLGVNYTAERIYNQFTPGRKNFRVEKDEYPRVGYLKSGDVFTTNVMFSETGVTVHETKIKTGLYWTAPTTFTTTAPTTGLKLQVVELTDTADGQAAFKIQVL